MKIYLLNYADDRFNHKDGKFSENQEILNRSAQGRGFDEIISWNYASFAQTSFYKENQEYLDQDRFINGVAWKPFIVHELLQRVDEGDIIFYYDCGPYTIDRSIQSLIRLCVRNGGSVFHRWGETNANYTKRDAFVLMDCDSPEFHNAVHLQNTWFLIQKNDKMCRFVEEWMEYNLDQRIASYREPNTCGKLNLPEYIENRGDQTIFSLLSIKYGIKSFKGASGFDNRQVNNFIDSLTFRNRVKHGILKLLKK